MLLLKYNLHLSSLFISFVLFWCNFCSMLKYILYAKVNVNLFAHWVILLLLLNCFYIWPPHENMASFAAANKCIINSSKLKFKHFLIIINSSIPKLKHFLIIMCQYMIYTWWGREILFSSSKKDNTLSWHHHYMILFSF
jgi:hypothetical protein